MAGAILTADLLRELLDYDPLTGVFTRKRRTSNRVRVGDAAGTRRPDGYLKISLLHRSFLAHRLAWMFVHGSMPEFEIDHINGRRDDNRIANLRDVKPQLNQQNHRRAHVNSSSGLIGATYLPKRRRWQAQIMTPTGYKYLGLHPSAELAHLAYIAAKRSLHEGCTI